MTPRLYPFVFTGLASLVLCPAALAGGPQGAGSLLIFPIFDHTRGAQTFITVTNDADQAPSGGTTDADQLRVEYVYIRHEEQFLPGGALNPEFVLDCTEFNRTRILTPKDTLTVSTKIDHPNATHRGYVYVFAKQGNAAGTGATPIQWNHLMGQVRVLSANGQRNFEMNAFTYEAVGGSATTTTDSNANQQRDLDGTEYQKTRDLLQFPRFIGQDFQPLPFTTSSKSELILIALTGGSQFTTLVDLLVYNDNEEVFSANDTVRCWYAKPLATVSSVFRNDFLVNSNDDDSEAMGDMTFGGVGLETGWFTARGLVASSSSTTIPNTTAGTTENPAILGVLLETPTLAVDIFVFHSSTAVVVPYGGTAQNGGGSLLPRSLTGL